MNCDPAIKLIRNVLDKLWIPNHIITEPFQWNDRYDLGLRKTILNRYSLLQNSFRSKITEFLEDNTIYHIVDTYHCEYMIMKLPGPQPLSALLIGPYTGEMLTAARCMTLCAEASVPGNLMDYMQQYYSNLPGILNDKYLKSLILTLEEELWGKEVSIVWKKYRTEVHSEKSQYLEIPSPDRNEMERITQRYQFESDILECISQGNCDYLQTLFDKGPPLINQRIADSLRDRKNLMIILNTLGRKAAEKGGVHPAYLDELSRKFALKIESSTSLPKLLELEHEIPRRYCLLVRSHSVRNYSLPIQKAINHISFHLNGDLSLTAISGLVGLNSSYFSALFKKETGCSLISYVNNARMERAIYLLNSTRLPIAEISHMCGMSDVNYFSKTFKKLKGFTPSEYRSLICRPKEKKLVDKE